MIVVRLSKASRLNASLMTTKRFVRWSVVAQPNNKEAKSLINLWRSMLNLRRMNWTSIVFQIPVSPSTPGHDMFSSTWEEFICFEKTHSYGFSIPCNTTNCYSLRMKPWLCSKPCCWSCYKFKMVSTINMYWLSISYVLRKQFKVKIWWQPEKRPMRTNKGSNTIPTDDERFLV